MMAAQSASSPAPDCIRDSCTVTAGGRKKGLQFPQRRCAGGMQPEEDCAHRDSDAARPREVDSKHTRGRSAFFHAGCHKPRCPTQSSSTKQEGTHTRPHQGRVERCALLRVERVQVPYERLKLRVRLRDFPLEDSRRRVRPWRLAAVKARRGGCSWGARLLEESATCGRRAKRAQSGQ